MRDIFTDLYNKVVEFFTKVDEREETKDVARNRLKLVLMQDRTNLNPRLLERLRGEMIQLLSKYVVMDKELLELNFTPEDDQLALMLSIPVIRAKDEDEIEEAIKAEDAEKERIAKLIEEAEDKDVVEEADDETEGEETANDDTEDVENEDISAEDDNENIEDEDISETNFDETDEIKEKKQKKKKNKYKKNKNSENQNNVNKEVETEKDIDAENVEISEETQKTEEKKSVENNEDEV